MEKVIDIFKICAINIKQVRVVNKIILVIDE